MSAEELAALASAVETLESITESRRAEWQGLREVWVVDGGPAEAWAKSDAFDSYLRARDTLTMVKNLRASMLDAPEVQA